MTALLALASVVIAIGLWRLLFKFVTWAAIIIAGILIIGVPIALVAYLVYKLVFRR